MADRGRFWGDDDESDDESDGSGEDGGGGGGGRVAAAAAAPAAGGAKARFVDLESDSESDDEKRVVRTAKDKRWDAMLSIIATLNKHLRANNWVEVEDSALLRGGGRRRWGRGGGQRVARGPLHLPPRSPAPDRSLTPSFRPLLALAPPCAARPPRPPPPRARSPLAPVPPRSQALSV